MTQTVTEFGEPSQIMINLGDGSEMPLFRHLDAGEAEQFRQWARDNDIPDPAAWDSYHPVCRTEWLKQGKMPAILAAAKCEESAVVLEALKPHHTRIDLVNMLKVIATGLNQKDDGELL